MARIDFCKELLVHKERTGIPLFPYSFFISTLEECIFKRCSLFKKALLCWRTRALNGEAAVAPCSQRAWAGRAVKSYQNLLPGACNFYLRSCWAWAPCGVLAQGPCHGGCRANSCITFFLQREHHANPEKANVELHLKIVQLPAEKLSSSCGPRSY